MYACGDDYFVPLVSEVDQVLTAMQHKDGEFADQPGNVVYTTAMAAMASRPLGYLPLYER